MNSPGLIGPFLGVGPARQRLGTAHAVRAKVQLRLIGNPDLATVDRIVELAEQRQPPLGVLQSLRVMIFPPKAFGRRLIGRDQCAAKSVG